MLHGGQTWVKVTLFLKKLRLVVILKRCKREMLITVHGASLVAQSVKNLPAVQETQVPSLGWKDPLEKEMATHSKIPWMEEPGSPWGRRESDMTERLLLSTDRPPLCENNPSTCLQANTVTPQLSWLLFNEAASPIRRPYSLALLPQITDKTLCLNGIAFHTLWGCYYLLPQSCRESSTYFKSWSSL